MDEFCNQANEALSQTATIPFLSSDFYKEIGEDLAFLGEVQLKIHRLKLDRGEKLSRNFCQQEGGFMVVSGRLQETGKDGLMHWYGPGDLHGFGFPSVCETGCETRAAEPSFIEFVPKPVMEKLAAQHPEAMLRIFKKIHQQVEVTHRRLGLMHGVVQDSDVFQFLKIIERRFSTTSDGFLALDATMEDWAKYLGLSVTTFRRVVRRLREMGLLERKGVRIRLLSAQELSP
jgi:CRP-like cAMP-binding protein